MLACDRVGVVSESRWRQLEQSVSNVSGSDIEAERRQTAAELLTVVRRITQTAWTAGTHGSF